MAKIKQLKDKSGTEQIFPKTKTQAIFNEDGSLLSETLDNLYGSLATIESSPTTTSHSVGEYILYEGQVYKVTAVIASGDSLVEGTNISAVNLGSQIDTLNGQVSTLNSKINEINSNASWTYCKMTNGTLICWGSGVIDVTAAQPDRKQITYPVPFVEYNPSIALTVVENAYNNQPLLRTWGEGLNSFYCLNRGQTPSVHVLFKWLAIGRWKN